mgnify:CR=1 FL=1|jgi:hypothetical protein|tara:strand:- start:2127 stop:2351 length:225 start_codon:yes stop_codon:yes gene_type:complete
MAAKKTVKTNHSKKEPTEYDILVLELINNSLSVTRSVLEVGSAMADDCHDVDYTIHKICNLKGYKREDYWEDFK